LLTSVLNARKKFLATLLTKDSSALFVEAKSFTNQEAKPRK